MINTDAKINFFWSLLLTSRFSLLFRKIRGLITGVVKGPKAAWVDVAAVVAKTGSHPIAINAGNKVINMVQIITIGFW